MSLTPLLSTVALSSDASRPTGYSPFLSSGPNSTNNTTSFVGNTPSTVLFFLAMSVGVAIACLFIFFTVRYFVRSRYGLHVYPVSNRGMMFSASFRDAGAITYTPSIRELQEHLDYLRTHHFLRDEFLERRILSGSARRRRRRRRGRYAKMKKLTADEVEKLFPKKLYAEWLRTGDEDGSEDVLLMRVDVVHEQSSSTSGRIIVPVSLPKQTNTETTSDFAVVEMHEMHDLRPRPSSNENHEDAVSLAVLLGGKGELHFDSGSCAICLETFEEEDIVRGLVCGHVFHAECVDPWLTRRRACCPICKRDYYKEESLDGTNEGLREGNGENDENVATGETSEGAEAGAANAGELPDGADGTTATSRPSNTTTFRARGDDDDSINYDALRTDPNLQALLQELIPISERVRVILEEHPELDLELRGREIANLKYSSVWKKIFWRLMGILKDDLYNWAVIKIYQTEQRNAANSAEAQSPTDPTATDEAAETGSQHSQSPNEIVPASPRTLNENFVTPVQTAEASGSRLSLPIRTPSPSISHPSTDPRNAPEMDEVDVSEALRREIAERRV